MKRRSGFTLVEVMVSIGVMTIGAMAMIGMQQQTTRGNVHARRLTTGMQIAQTWIERLKVDGIRWRTVGNSATDLTNTTFLGVNGGDGTDTGGGPVFTTIVIPPAFPAGAVMSNGFDFDGRDVPVDAPSMGNVTFCASYRLTWVYRNPITGADDRALRADVRVWWAKETGTTVTGNANSLAVDFDGCADDGIRLNPGAQGTEYNNYHVVYLSTVIRPML